MSRIANNPVAVPNGVEVFLDGQALRIKGAKGELTAQVHNLVSIDADEGFLSFKASEESKNARALAGTFRSLVNNMVQGVTEGFQKELEIRGVGYQANMDGNYLVLQLGYSHDIFFEPPSGIEIKTNKTEVIVSGINKQLVGEVSAKIRSFRKPEPYKGKGIRYKDEYVRSKQGKTVGGATG